ncbi:MAG: GNAT family protein [Tissierellia bacterium]|nr:GNAT family protein [Tissierellia bacterium]
MIKSDKICLRYFEISDIENKVKWINDSKNNEFLHYDIPINYEGTLNWFLNKQKNREDFVIEYEESPVGVIGLINIDNYNKKAEYYITIGSHEHKRKGIASGSSLLLLRHAFEELGLNKVYLNVDADNTSACKLYEKIGFKCEGTFKDELFFRGKFIDRKRYAFLYKEWIKVEED